MDCQAIWEEATEAARAAVRGARHLENPTAFDCGYAWVVITPARGPFINWLRAQKTAHVQARPGDRRAPHDADSRWGSRRDYGGGGWQFWMPGREEHSGQSIAVFEAGAQAMAEVLQRHGMNAQAGSRLD